MANQKTNRRRLGQTAPPERPGHNSALVVAAGSAVRPSRSGQGLSRCGRSQEHRCILPAPDTERPQTTENVFGRGSNGGVVAPRKSAPRERRCNTISALRRQMAVPTIAMLWRYLFSLARWRELARNDGADHGCACPGHNTERSPYRSDATQQVHRKKRKLTKRSARMADRYLPGAQLLRRA